jgi:triosephosphate isomerase
MEKIIIANWKMNPQSKKEAESLFMGTSKLLKNIKNVEIIICPPFPYLYIKDKIKNKNIKLGSQDVFYEKEGSFTGEVSLSMVKNFGTEFVLVGHSERRVLGDTDSIINKKIIASLKSKINPILCIGESKRDSNGFYLSFVKQQIEEALSGVTNLQMKNIIFAYEPIWAIGSSADRVATPAEFMEIRIFIKKIIADLYGIKTANYIKIIYGGSVNPLNAQSFIIEGQADGLLVGRDSLNPKKFSAIINLVK